MLSRAGHRVTLIDARSGPGEGASMGNAAQLSWAYGDAMASPSMLRHLPEIALGHDPAFRIQWQLDPDIWMWGLRFLLNGSDAKWWANTAAVLALAEKSRQGRCPSPTTPPASSISIRRGRVSKALAPPSKGRPRSASSST